MQLYAASTRQELAKKLGVTKITVSTIQAALRRLTRNGLLTKDAERGTGLGLSIVQALVNIHQVRLEVT